MLFQALRLLLWLEETLILQGIDRVTRNKLCYGRTRWQRYCMAMGVGLMVLRLGQEKLPHQDRYRARYWWLVSAHIWYSPFAAFWVWVLKPVWMEVKS